MQKAVLRVEWCNERERKRAMKIVSAYEGIQSVAVDRDNKKLTVIGDMDPVQLAENLRKRFDTDIEYLGPKETRTKPDPEPVHPDPDPNINRPNNPYPYPYPYPSYPYPYPCPCYPYYPLWAPPRPPY